MIQPPRIVPSPMDGDTFTVEITEETKDAVGSPVTTTPTMRTGVAGNLQPMSAARSMQFGFSAADNLYDLYLPITHEGNNILARNKWYFQKTTGGVSAERYQALGNGMAQGDSGRQLIPVRTVVRS